MTVIDGEFCLRTGARCCQRLLSHRSRIEIGLKSLTYLSFHHLSRLIFSLHSHSLFLPSSFFLRYLFLSLSSRPEPLFRSLHLSGARLWPVIIITLQTLQWEIGNKSRSCGDIVGLCGHTPDLCLMSWKLVAHLCDLIFLPYQTFTPVVVYLHIFSELSPYWTDRIAILVIRPFRTATSPIKQLQKCFILHATMT